MPVYSEESNKQLATCNDNIQRLFNEVIKHHDCRIIEGEREEEKQNYYFSHGLSKVKYPEGKHNIHPSDAADVAPYPVQWVDKNIIMDQLTPYQRREMEKLVRWYFFAGYVKGIASQLGIPIRWGGDWDGDNIFTDQTFNDLPHFESVT